MLRNKIPLCVFIGVNLIILGIFFSCIGIRISSDINRNVSFESGFAITAFLSVSLGLIFSGFGLLLRQHWARILINIILIIGFVMLALGTYFFVLEMSNSVYRRHTITQLGILVFSFSILMGAFLFINNSRVVNELNSKRSGSEI